MFDVNNLTLFTRNLVSWGPHFRSVGPLFFIYVLLEHLLYNRCHVWRLFFLKSASLFIFSRFLTFMRNLAIFFSILIMNWLFDAHRRREFHVPRFTFFQVFRHLHVLEGHTERLRHHPSIFACILSTVWRSIIYLRISQVLVGLALISLSIIHLNDKLKKFYL